MFGIGATVIAAGLCFLFAHHLRLARDTGMALLSAGVGLYLLVPSWPGAAYDLIEKAWLSAPEEGASLLASVVFVVVIGYGCKLIFFGDSGRR